MSCSEDASSFLSPLEGLNVFISGADLAKNPDDESMSKEKVIRVAAIMAMHLAHRVRRHVPLLQLDAVVLLICPFAKAFLRKSFCL